MNVLLLRDCRLIDGLADRPVEPVDVLVEGSHIRRIGSSLQASPQAQVIDVGRRTVLPGLIDAHVHLAFDGGADPVGRLLNEPADVSLLIALRNAQLTLRRGVTSVRDLGSPAGITPVLRNTVRRGLVPGPRILCSGPVITSPRGHCFFMGHEVDAAEAAQQAAQHEIQQGADVVKVMATGGALTLGSSVDETQFSEEVLSAVVRHAHSQGLKVAAHANGLEGLRNAVHAGVDSIEHGSFADQGVMDAMLVRGTWWVPTMTPARVILEGPRSQLISSERSASAGRNWQARRRAVEAGIRMGVKMVSGTDGGVTYTDHGLVSLEVETFHLLGMPAMQAIWTATRWAAELLGIDDRVGTIADGKTADMILIDGDPLADLTLLRGPSLVIQNGQIVDCGAPPWPDVL